AALSSVFRRRPGLGPRLPRVAARAERQLRPALRRQHQDGGADRAAAADPGKMAQQRALQPVLRYRQHLLGPEEREVLWAEPAPPGSDLRSPANRLWVQ